MPTNIFHDYEEMKQNLINQYQQELQKRDITISQLTEELKNLKLTSKTIKDVAKK